MRKFTELCSYRSILCVGETGPSSISPSCSRPAKIRSALNNAIEPSALGVDWAEELTGAVAQQQLAPEAASQVRPLVEISLAALNLLAFFLVLAIAMTQEGQRGGGPVLPIMLAVVVLIAPALITAMRTPFRRERFLTFVISGVLAAYLLESPEAWAITLGHA